VAQGNIIVLGALRGMVHAGAGGNLSCFVSALGLMPTQLRIANIITSVRHVRAGGVKTYHPEYAYIQNGQVYISSLLK
jgi:septum site-determining protein MinC